MMSLKMVSRRLTHAVSFVAAVIGLTASAEVELPEGYTALEWVQSTGTQYVDTLYKVKAGDVVKAVMEVPREQPADATAFGAQPPNAPWDNSCVLDVRMGSEGTYRAFRNNKKLASGTDASFYGQKIAVRIDASTFQWKIFGASAWTEQWACEQAGDCAQTMFVFAVNSAAADGKSPFRCAVVKLYSLTVESASGALVRDFVPCRNPSGEAGLWDKVEGAFCDAKGTGRLSGSDPDVRLNWVASNGGQYVDSYYKVKSSDVVKAVMEVPREQAADATAFGSQLPNAPWNDSCAMDVRMGDVGTYRAWRGKNKYSTGTNASFYGQKIAVQIDPSYFQWKIFGATAWTEQSPCAASGDCAQTMFVFAINSAAANKTAPARYATVKLYSLSVENGGGTTQLDLVPYRQNGLVGLYDTVTEQFLPSIGSEALSFGVACAQDGTVLQVYDGTLAADDLFDGCTEVVKAGRGELYASAVASYPALTLAEGYFSVRDGEPQPYAVAGVLTLKGGAKLRLDVTADGADTFTVGSLVLDDSVTAENPVRVNLVASGVTEVTESITLITGGNLAAGDLAKFTFVSDLPAQLAIENGELKVKKEVATAVWTGAAGDGNPRMPGNWTCADSTGETIGGVLPGPHTMATVPAGTTNFSFPADKVISLDRLRFLGDTYTLNADADWSGIVPGLVAQFPAKIDVNGHRLKLSAEPVVTASDLTTPGGNIRVTYLGSSFLAGGLTSSPEGLIDNVHTTDSRLLIGNFQGCYFDYDFGANAGKVVRGVRFFTRTKDYPNRRPKAFSVLGTMVDPEQAEDGDWTLLKSYSNQNMGHNAWSGCYALDNETAYRAYRIHITETTGDSYLELYEMELLDNVPGTAGEVTSSKVAGEADAVDLTVSGGAVSATDLNGNSITLDGASSLAGLVDNNVSGNGRFLKGWFSGCRIVYDFGANQSQIVRGVRFYCPTSKRCPSDLVVSGTTADPAEAKEADWTPIASRTGLLLRAPGWTGYQILDNKTPYRAYRITITKTMGDSYLEFYEMELVGSALEPGELHYIVPEGVTLQNVKTRLSGSLKVVKEGAGSMTAGLGSQTFVGGVELLDGTSSASGWGSDRRWGAAGGTITIGTNAVFELQGKPRFVDYPIVLKGGTLRNSTSAEQTHNQLEGVKSIRVATDSTIDFTKGYSLMAYANNAYGPTTLDLQRNNLTVNSVYGGSDFCYFANTTATRGTVTLYGALGFIGGAFMGPETTLDLHGCIMPEVDVHVGTYICRTTSGSSDQNFDVYVYECFKPLTDMFWGCVLKSGVTLDLSEHTEAWNVKGTFHTAEKTTVRFEDNATIYIDLGNREVKARDQIVAWNGTTSPSNVSTLKFKPKSKANYIFVTKETGVYVSSNNLAIFIR